MHGFNHTIVHFIAQAGHSLSKPFLRLASVTNHLNASLRPAVFILDSISACARQILHQHIARLLTVATRIVKIQPLIRMFKLSKFLSRNRR